MINIRQSFFSCIECILYNTDGQVCPAFSFLKILNLMKFTEFTEVQSCIYKQTFLQYFFVLDRAYLIISTPPPKKTPMIIYDYLIFLEYNYGYYSSFVWTNKYRYACTRRVGKTGTFSEFFDDCLLEINNERHWLNQNVTLSSQP